MSPGTRSWLRWSSSVRLREGWRSATGLCSTRGSRARPAASIPCAPPVTRGPQFVWSFTSGALGPGVHVGVTTDAPGAWADLLAAHDSMLIPVPDAARRLAVLADPFAVSMHAILRHPPPAGGQGPRLRGGRPWCDECRRAAGALPRRRGGGRRALCRPSRVRHATRGERGLRPRAAAGLVEELAEWSGGVLHKPFDGLPVAHPGGIDVVYDTIARPETLEVGVRRAGRARHPRPDRVSRPGRWEWTPDLLQGAHHRRVQRLRHRGGGRGSQARHRPLPGHGSVRPVDLTGMLTHRFPLDRWWDALRAIARQDESGAIKVAFEAPRVGRPDYDSPGDGTGDHAERPIRARPGEHPGRRTARTGSGHLTARGTMVAVVAGEPASKRALRSARVARPCASCSTPPWSCSHAADTTRRESTTS